ncbi:hypothetical protein HanXRQr2_Chr05g0208751 [Helianthus annuus]|uniref:Uncharacterized protein n=1 Tax=Helianthus annuus TaxID=4232 RepID=A0A9K3IYG5_HELAN|nr:hypothetical protein HanXRQr2_Chr05g0208751 [Helianthus annuus]KAJ0922270.1 hypothetical protein HanPSC8_Chr05g0201751 [Helianthus annuus]
MGRKLFCKHCIYLNLLALNDIEWLLTCWNFCMSFSKACFIVSMLIEDDFIT